MTHEEQRDKLMGLLLDNTTVDEAANAILALGFRLPEQLTEEVFVRCSECVGGQVGENDDGVVHYFDCAKCGGIGFIPLPPASRALTPLDVEAVKNWAMDFSSRECSTRFIEQLCARFGVPQGRSEAETGADEYRANFLWGFEDDSIESIGYEFANARTEEWRKVQWDRLIAAMHEKR